MSLEKKTLAARYDDEDIEFIVWLAKNADGGFGVKRAQILKRGWSFLRALYALEEDALNPITLQRLLCLHGLPRKEATTPGLSSTRDNPAQARLFFSRLAAGRVGLEVAGYRPPTFPSGFRSTFASRITLCR